jgi:hypothetical protein
MLMKKPSRPSEHTAASVLGTDVRKAFREPIQHVFSASLTFWGSTVP